MSGKSPDHARLDRVVAEARRAREQREQGYRERALKIYPGSAAAARASSTARPCIS